MSHLSQRHLSVVVAAAAALQNLCLQDCFPQTQRHCSLLQLRWLYFCQMGSWPAGVLQVVQRQSASGYQMLSGSPAADALQAHRSAVPPTSLHVRDEHATTDIPGMLRQ